MLAYMIYFTFLQTALFEPKEERYYFKSGANVKPGNSCLGSSYFLHTSWAFFTTAAAIIAGRRMQLGNLC
jgi:hypothetical protein